MSIDLYSKLNWKDIRHLIIYHCAPLLAGLKISNLLVIDESDYRKACEFLEGTSIEMYILSRKDRKIALLLFDRNKLSEYINECQNKQFMIQMGYTNCCVDKVLYELSVRYNSYQNGNGIFPHELGIVLGYPLVDVYGFMANDGEKYILNGYWKVYGQETKARETFRAYDEATQLLVTLFVERSNLERLTMLGLAS